VLTRRNCCTYKQNGPNASVRRNKDSAKREMIRDLRELQIQEPTRINGTQKEKFMIDLYYWPTPNGWKVTIMLKSAIFPTPIKPSISSRGTNCPQPFSSFRPTGGCR